MKMSRKKKKEKYAVLYGFNIKNKNKTGYLKIDRDGYSIVQDKSAAAGFSISTESGRGTPEDWCRFFKDEPEISDWRFHPVILIR